MEDKEEYQVPLSVEEQEQKPEPATEEAAPVSILLIAFAAPGSAEVVKIGMDGIVTNGQIAAAAQFLTARAIQEWSMPLIEATVDAVITTFMKKMNQPRVQTLDDIPFFVPPMPGQGKV